MSANIIDGNGIQIETFSDIWNDLVNGTPGVPGLLQIYGADANINQNSPDGQWINNFALAKQDILELLVQIYNAKDPDQAVGIDLDSVCQLCGIARMGGTYTQVNVLINTSQALNLSGQDTSTPYTVQDSNGNQYQLIVSASLVSGNNTFAFQAVNIGAVQCLANVITIPVTVVAGVNSINNPSPAYQTGVDEETDAQFRQRRQLSVNLPAQGAVDGLVGGLLTISGVNQAVIYENLTGVTNADGVPSHSIWVIVDGGGTSDIANMIYNYRSMGCGMYGGTSGAVTLPSGTAFVVYFDRVVLQNLYIQFHLTSINNGAIDNNLIINSLVSDYVFSIYETADITTITSLIHQIDSTLIVSSCQVSTDNVNWYNSVIPTAKLNKFLLTSGQITII